jgi:hypothetical protein
MGKHAGSREIAFGLIHANALSFWGFSVESQLFEVQMQVLRLAALAPYEQNVGGAGL